MRRIIATIAATGFIVLGAAAPASAATSYDSPPKSATVYPTWIKYAW